MKTTLSNMPRRRMPAANPTAQTLTLEMDAPPPAPKRAPHVSTAPVRAKVPAPADTLPVKQKSAPAARAVKPAPVKATPAPKVKSVTAPKAKPIPAAKKTTVRVKASVVPKTEPIRVVSEVALGGGRLWKMTGRFGVAYVQNAALAGELLAVEPKRLAQQAMAVYYDKKGKPFAWQVRFDTQRWDEVMRRLA